MNLPPVPSNLTAKSTAKLNCDSYNNIALDFYNKCLEKIKGDYSCYDGRYSCSLNSEDIPEKVLSAVKNQLETAGYEVKTGFDMFTIYNPFFTNMQS